MSLSVPRLVAGVTPGDTAACGGRLARNLDERRAMTRGRLEAFSDGVIAIIITIMVLELKVPHGNDLAALGSLLPKLGSYVLSFVMLGIYWNNHHHLMHAVHQVDGRVMWANLHLLFWLSLMPFVTGWAGESRFASWPVLVYGGVLLMAGTAYFILVRALIALHGQDSQLAAAIGRDSKGIISIIAYLVAMPLALVTPVLACAIYVLVAVLWLVPDRRIERALGR
jgi:uncharacterized membrane protein